MRILFCLVALLFTAAPVHAKKRSSPFAKARRAMMAPTHPRAIVATQWYAYPGWLVGLF